MTLTITHIGVATMLLEIGSLRLLTDPVVDWADYQAGKRVRRSGRANGDSSRRRCESGMAGVKM